MNEEILDEKMNSHTNNGISTASGVQQQKRQHQNGIDSMAPIQVETFGSFPVNQAKEFNIILADHCKPSNLSVAITNPILGVIDAKLSWIRSNNNPSNNSSSNPQTVNKCRVSFVAPIVGLYTIDVAHDVYQQCNTTFIAKAYDLSKVFIHRTQAKCRLNTRYEFSVDASEAGEGQLEIAVNEGEIPNQVQVLDNGKCIVNFVPEDSVPHMVDIKFNGHNVNGCPFVVEAIGSNHQDVSDNPNIEPNKQQVAQLPLKPILKRDERVLVNNPAIFSIENIRLENLEHSDVIVLDPDGKKMNYTLSNDLESQKCKFELLPTTVGDHSVEIVSKSGLINKLPSDLIEQFPFPLKVFDHRRVNVSDVTDGVVGNPVYFFIDASQAGSGNLEIRVSSSNRNVPNYPQTEANAKIRVYFTPTEAVDHSIDIKFNGMDVPGNPFLVKVSKNPQARLPILSKETLKYVALDETAHFVVEYNRPEDGGKVTIDKLTESNIQVYVLKPDLVYSKLDTIELIKTVDAKTNHVQANFMVSFKPSKIGPHKIFAVVNNELVPSCPIISNVYNINEVRVAFSQIPSLETMNVLSKSVNAYARLNEPMNFIVDASRAGEGTLSLAVLSGVTRSPIQNEVNVSEKGHGLYELTFIPTEFVIHSIIMSFNDRTVLNSPFTVDIVDANGKLASSIQNKLVDEKTPDTPNQMLESKDNNKQTNQMVQNFEAMNLKSGSAPDVSRKSNQLGSGLPTRKSLAYGLVNASNIVYLESGVLENNKNHVSLFGPNGEKVSFVLGKGSPRKGEPKKTYIEYKPKLIGTHTINVLENGKDLRQYFVETCDPSLAKVSGLHKEGSQQYVVGRPVTFTVDSHRSGDIQLDGVTITGPKIKIKDGEQTILNRIKSLSGSSSSSSANNFQQPLEYTIQRLSDNQQEVTFKPQIPGKHVITLRCLGQLVGSSPYEIEVMDARLITDQNQIKSDSLSRDEKLLRNIVVHGVSLKCSPVNSTGAFIIETDQSAQAGDFDVLITDPNNSLVDVQCYLQQDGNLLAEWTPRRVGPHKIQVLYKDRQVPGSPFTTEAFDPSRVVIDKIESFSVSINEKIEFKVDRQHAGQGELDVAISSPVGQDLRIDVRPLSDDNGHGELISFVPPVAGKYKLSILFGGLEVSKSPLIFTVRDDSEPVKVSGLGLRCAEVNRTAQFSFESGNEGQIKVRIECGDREIVPKIEKRDRKYTIKYKPIEVGYAAISLYWNGSHIEGSPFAVPINDLSKILFLSGSNRLSNSNNQRIVQFEPDLVREITLDTSKCGPGELIAEAYCRANPSIKFSLPVDRYAVNRYMVSFVCPPHEEQLAEGVKLNEVSSNATYIIRFYYNNMSIPEHLASVVVTPYEDSVRNPNQPSDSSTILSNGRENDKNNNTDGVISKSKLLPVSEQSSLECPIVSLRGNGLAEAICNEKAEFTIDGSKAGPGKPEVSLTNSDNINVDIQLIPIDNNVYRAFYVASIPGTYTLNVLWDAKQVAGCPTTVTVNETCDPSKVICIENGLKGCVQGEEFKVLIDTRRAGPGELTALCTGPKKVAFCELLDRGDGTFILYIKPQESGRHFLSIKYAGQHIPKSPFMIKVSGKPDPTKVRVHGPGLEHGVLSLYQSRFVCDTHGAGAGQLTVRIRGPKGAFKIDTQRESQRQRDRRILCKYDPTEPGDYRIEIKWSNHHVPGSPFHVMIFDTQEELNRFLNGNPMNQFYYQEWTP